MNKRYVVHLTAEEREQIEKLLRLGMAHARKLLYGRILLKAPIALVHARSSLVPLVAGEHVASRASGEINDRAI
jgi:hypothetical protein